MATPGQRSAARLAAVQALYEMEISGKGLNETKLEFESFWIGNEIEGVQYNEAEIAFFNDILAGVLAAQEPIDRLIDKTLAAGWPLAQAVCNFVHNHIRFDYMQARANRTALEVYRERAGVCRDYMHLAITFCRSLNIPARYCTGYLGDIGVPPDPAPMDFSAWFEVYLGGAWHTFDSRHNTPRIGPHTDRAWARRGGCRDQHDIRCKQAGRVFGGDRGSRGELTKPRVSPVP